MKTESTVSGGASVLASRMCRRPDGSRGRSPHQSLIFFAPLLLCALALIPLGLAAATNDLSGLLQKGLFEEEANRNLEAAAQAYSTVSVQFDKDRKLAATAIFRLGEIYRKQGKTNEAAGQYERIVREFADQDTLVTLSRQNLAGLGAARRVIEALVQTPADSTATARAQEAALLERIHNFTLEQARQFLPTLVPDELLTRLLAQYQATEAKRAEQVVKYAPEHPEIKALESLIKKLDEQIVQRIAGIIKALEIRVAAASAPAQSAGFPTESAATDDEEKEIRRIRAMIQNSPDLINAPSGSGFTPLHTAAAQGQLTVAGFLLDNKANVNARSSNGETPLRLAAGQGHKAMVELLLSRGADVNAPGGDGYTALHYAATHGFNALAETLLANQAEIDARNQTGATPLHLAAAGGHAALLEALLNRRADVNAVDKSGRTPLFNAAMGGHSAAVKILVTGKANSDAVDNQGRTALSYAAEKGHIECVNALLAAKADPNSGRNNLPLHRAIHARSPAMVAALLSANADANRVTEISSRQALQTGTTFASYTGSPLFAAMIENDPEIAKLLLQFKADANGRTPDRLPFVVASANNSALLKLLLDAGADPNATVPESEGGATALHVAAANGNRESVRLLLEHGAKPNVTAIYGQHGVTPLMRAANGKDAELVALLLKNKADPNLVDERGNTALSNALNFGSLDVVRALLTGSANPETRNNRGETPLGSAVGSKQDKALASALIEAKANVNAPAADGKTPLHYAVMLNRKDLIELLLAAGADVNLRDESGKTPLDMAKQTSQATFPTVPMLAPLTPAPSRPAASTSVESKPADIAALLRQHGARDDLPNFNTIRITRQGFPQPLVVFSKGPKLTNQFTALEVVMSFYGQNRRDANSQPIIPYMYLPFPDFGRLIIRRPSRTSVGKEQEIKISLRNSSNVMDCAKDVPVEFGDVIEIPERVHALNENAPDPVKELEFIFSGRGGRTLPPAQGQSDDARRMACLVKSVQLRVAGETTALTVDSWKEGFLSQALAKSDARAVLRSSSDLSRVKVTRKDAKSGQPLLLTVDVSDSPQRNDDLWLRDGDMIEVPDKP